MTSSLSLTGFLVLVACGGAKPGDTTDAPAPADGATDSPRDAVLGDAALGDAVVPPPSCGDGHLDQGEACDDGNTKPGDGCDIFCKVQVGYTCTPASPSVCTPNPRTNPASVIALGGGAGSHLILKLDGSVWDWGAMGKLGNPTYNGAKANFPVQVVAGAGPADAQGHLIAGGITAGEVTNYAVDRNHQVWSWGGNPEEALGDGMTTAQQGTSATPVGVVTSSGAALVPLASIAALGSRGSHALALDTNGHVWAWGENESGQLGNNTVVRSPFAVEVVGPGGTGVLSSVIAISGSGTHSVALTADHTVWTWGANLADQLGDGIEATSSPTPVHVLADTGSPLADIVMISAGWDHNLALDSTGRVWSWGNNVYAGNQSLLSGELGRPVTNNATRSSAASLVLESGGQPLANVIAVSSGDWYGTALKSDGTVWSWGDNVFGQMADGALSTINVMAMPPVFVVNNERLAAVQAQGPGGVGFLTDVIMLSAREASSLAVKADGSVWTWGDNRNFQLGDMAFAPDRSAYPVPVTGLGPTPNP